MKRNYRDKWMMLLQSTFCAFATQPIINAAITQLEDCPPSSFCGKQMLRVARSAAKTMNLVGDADPALRKPVMESALEAMVIMYVG